MLSQFVRFPHKMVAFFLALNLLMPSSAYGLRLSVESTEHNLQERLVGLEESDTKGEGLPKYITAIDGMNVILEQRLNTIRSVVEGTTPKEEGQFRDARTALSGVQALITAALEQVNNLSPTDPQKSRLLSNLGERNHQFIIQQQELTKLSREYQRSKQPVEMPDEESSEAPEAQLSYRWKHWAAVAVLVGVTATAIWVWRDVLQRESLSWEVPIVGLADGSELTPVGSPEELGDKEIPDGKQAQWFRISGNRLHWLKHNSPELAVWLQWLDQAASKQGVAAPPPGAQVYPVGFLAKYFSEKTYGGLNSIERQLLERLKQDQWIQEVTPEEYRDITSEPTGIVVVRESGNSDAYGRLLLRMQSRYPKFFTNPQPEKVKSESGLEEKKDELGRQLQDFVTQVLRVNPGAGPGVDLGDLIDLDGLVETTGSLDLPPELAQELELLVQLDELQVELSKKLAQMGNLLLSKKLVAPSEEQRAFRYFEQALDLAATLKERERPFDLRNLLAEQLSQAFSGVMDRYVGSPEIRVVADRARTYFIDHPLHRPDFLKLVADRMKLAESITVAIFRGGVQDFLQNQNAARDSEARELMEIFLQDLERLGLASGSVLNHGLATAVQGTQSTDDLRIAMEAVWRTLEGAHSLDAVTLSESGVAHIDFESVDDPSPGAFPLHSRLEMDGLIDFGGSAAASGWSGSKPVSRFATTVQSELLHVLLEKKLFEKAIKLAQAGDSFEVIASRIQRRLHVARLDEISQAGSLIDAELLTQIFELLERNEDLSPPEMLKLAMEGGRLIKAFRSMARDPLAGVLAFEAQCGTSFMDVRLRLLALSQRLMTYEPMSSSQIFQAQITQEIVLAGPATTTLHRLGPAILKVTIRDPSALEKYAGIVTTARLMPTEGIQLVKRIFELIGRKEGTVSVLPGADVPGKETLLVRQQGDELFVDGVPLLPEEIEYFLVGRYGDIDLVRKTDRIHHANWVDDFSKRPLVQSEALLYATRGRWINKRQWFDRHAANISFKVRVWTGRIRRMAGLEEGLGVPVFNQGINQLTFDGLFGMFQESLA